MCRNIFVTIVIIIFTCLILDHLIKKFIEPFSSDTTEIDVDMNEDIQINKDKLEEVSANYFGMKEANISNDTDVPGTNDAVDSSFT